MSAADKTRSRAKVVADPSSDDVLERLARLGDAPPEEVDALTIPAIVEADPSQPITVPSARVAEPVVPPVVREPAADTDVLTPVVATTTAATAATAARRIITKPTVVRRGRPRVRRVTRVVRHVDTWSVFKVALVFNALLYLVCLTAGVLLWNVANATGTVDNVEKFFEQFGWQSFQFKGGELFHNAWIAGLFVAIGLTGLAVLVATIFNLITDLVGGIRVSVLEEEVVARAPARSTDAPA